MIAAAVLADAACSVLDNNDPTNSFFTGPITRPDTSRSTIGIGAFSKTNGTTGLPVKPMYGTAIVLTPARSTELALARSRALALCGASIGNTCMTATASAGIARQWTSCGDAGQPSGCAKPWRRRARSWPAPRRGACCASRLAQLPCRRGRTIGVDRRGGYLRGQSDGVPSVGLKCRCSVPQCGGKYCTCAAFVRRRWAAYARSPALPRHA